MIALSLYKNKKLKLINKKIARNILPKQCRLEILYSGICASDIPRAFDSMAYKYPLIMGHEFVARVIKTGSKVNKFHKGDLVSAFPLIPCTSKNNKKICEYCNEEKFNLCKNYDYYGSRSDGSFCEILDVNEWNIFKLTNGKNIKLYSLIEPTAVTFNIFESFKKVINNRSKILILGGGFIGQILFKILKKYKNNLHLHILDRNQFKLDMTKVKSSTQILLSRKKNKNKFLFNKLDSKFDIVVETSGHFEHFLNAIEFAKKEGTVIFSGNINKKLIIDKNQISNILRKQLNIKGVWNSTFKSKVNNWKQAEKFISKNQNLERLITHTSDLNDAADLLKKIHLKKRGIIKNDYLKGLIKSF